MEFGRRCLFRKFALGKGMGTGKSKKSQVTRKTKVSPVASKGMTTLKRKMKVSAIGGKGMWTGKMKNKVSQGDFLVRGEYFTCPGMHFRFRRPMRRFFGRRCIKCALKFNSVHDQAGHLQDVHRSARVCTTCFQSYRRRADLFSAHHFLVPVVFDLDVLGVVC